MRLIGGELEFKNDGIFSYITDSGRSSLKLLLSGALRNKKFLLPDFLCEVILWVFDEYHVDYSFYKVNVDLTIDTDSIKNNEFDAIYIINYFGQKNNDVSQIIDPDILVVEDCVFSPIVEKPSNINNWIGFNSFRKISYLADGSIIKSTMKLDESVVNRNEPEFSALKYEAKKIKYEFIYEGRHSEKQYLALFEKAEKCIDAQKNVHSISERSTICLYDFMRNLINEYSLRRNNYGVLDLYFKNINIKIKSDYYSHYILFIENRDELRKHLFDKKIFLPIHWPRVDGLHNVLYEKIISIPVYSNYSQSDMETIARYVLDFIN